MKTHIFITEVKGIPLVSGNSIENNCFQEEVTGFFYAVKIANGDGGLRAKVGQLLTVRLFMHATAIGDRFALGAYRYLVGEALII